ncbi:hypothetical protein ASG98_17895 [Bacillus sp. Soil531]|nr:hypothetical protein ASG98_17895 [Bacillus sp. Soil531]PFK43351.1 hypothetical protein COJ23_25185 [Priestia megaterium]PGR76416.1 hypothetical protein COC53_29420 [Priestia megaterium]
MQKESDKQTIYKSKARGEKNDLGRYRSTLRFFLQPEKTQISAKQEPQLEVVAWNIGLCISVLPSVN